MGQRTRKDGKTKSKLSKTTQAASAATESQGDTHQRGDLDKEVSPDDREKVEEITEDVPVLSHKAARKQLKRKRNDDDVEEVPSTNQGQSGENANKKSKTNEKVKRSMHGIWVGNLNFATTETKLRDFLTSHLLAHEGQITRVAMSKPMKPRDANKGHAHVDFDNETITKAAVALSETNLDGRRLLIKKNEDFTGRPNVTSSIKAVLSVPDPAVDAATREQPSSLSNSQTQASMSKSAKKIAERQKNQPGPTLFLGNLSFETLEKDIRSLFEANHRASAKWLPKGITKAAKKKDADPQKARTSKQDHSKSRDEKDESDSASDDSSANSDEDASSSDGSDGNSGITQDNAGIRQIRMGTFEDSGKCKGWAFVDFETVRNATIGLLNPRNHKLNGRELKVEYAGLDAIRRGGNKMTQEMKKELEKANKGKKYPHKSKSFSTNGRAQIARPIAPPAKILTLDELNAPMEKTHKPTKEERQAARQAKKMQQQAL